MSEDPIGLQGGLNLYAFAGGDPVNGADPSGLDFMILSTDLSAEEGAAGSIWSDFWNNLTAPNYSFGALGGAAGSGAVDLRFRPIADSSDDQAVQEGESCLMNIFMASLTLASDVTFFTGVGAGVRLSRAAARAGRYGLSGVFGTAQGRAFAMVDGGRKLSAASRVYGRTADIYAVGAFGRAAGGVTDPGFNAWDFVPGVASARAVANAYQACR